MNEIKFSFVIPLYNKDGALLKRCLCSIPKSDDIQIIVVDDHTPSYYDENDILKKSVYSELPFYGSRNVDYIFLKENRGPGYARNFGINKAKGEWILFCDIDDFYNTTDLNKLLTILKETEADVVNFAYSKVNGTRVCTVSHELSEKQSFFFRVSDEDRNILLSDMFPWLRVVRKNFILSHNLRFKNLYLSEDREFCLLTTLLAKNIYYYSVPVYNYVLNEFSLSHVVPNKEKVIGAVQEAININRLLKKYKKLSIYRDDTLPKYLGILYDLNIYQYWYYTIKNSLFVGFKEAQKDRNVICFNRNEHTNIFRQWKGKIFKQ